MMVEKSKADARDIGQEDARRRKRISDILRDGRLSLDRELKDVADKLCIRLPFLEAIESGRYQDLPGNTYAIGFVRGYAEYLGLDSALLVEQFKQESAELERRTELHFPKPIPGGRVPGGAIFFVCIFLAVIFYGAWVVISSDGKSVTEMVSRLPVNLAEMIGVATGESRIMEEKTAIETAIETGTSRSETGLADTDAGAAGRAVQTPAPATTTGAGGGITEGDAGEITPAAPAIDASLAAPTAETAMPDAGGDIGTESVSDSQMTGESLTQAVEGMAEDEGVDNQSLRLENQSPASRSAPRPTSGAAILADSTTDKLPAAPAFDENSLAEASPIPEAGAAPAFVSGGGDAPEEIATDGQGEIETPAPLDAIQTADQSGDSISPPLTPPAVERAPRIYGEENRDARVVITANTLTWVEITAPSGELLLTRLLGKGDSYRVPSVTGLILITGNAGGLDFKVDGQAVPPIGPVGSVRRGVLLDPESLKRGSDR